jgi:electron transport complex protein RnfD
MSTGSKLFTVGPGPHWRSKSSVAQMNYAYLAALIPAAVIGAIAYAFGPQAITAIPAESGWLPAILRALVREFGVPAGVLNLAGAVGVLCLGAGAGILIEYLVQVAFRQPYYAPNGHGALMGLLMAMLMPPTVPWWVLAIGVAAAIIVGKQIYGGIGGYPFHPALVGWLILLLSWQNHIYPVGMKSIASMHWVAIYMTLFGGIALAALGHIRWQIPAGVLAGVIIAGAAFHYLYPDRGPGPWWQDGFMEIMAGHVMLAAFFLATDSTSSPVNNIPMLLYGLGVGILIMLIRTYGVWPDAAPFAVLIMNLVQPLLDRIRPAIKEVVIQNG